MHTKTTLTWIFFGLSLTYAWMMLATQTDLQMEPLRLRGLLVSQFVKQPQWQTFDEQDMDDGVTVSAGINTLFHLPLDIEPIRRQALFGTKGRSIRYWGYCYAEEDVPNNPAQTTGFPGKMFLSEGERTWRLRREEAQRPQFSIFNPPSKEDLSWKSVSGLIRHQLDVFQPGMTCYVMAQTPLALGTDRDGDGLNSRTEGNMDTDPSLADTDGDGLDDGTEVLYLGTKPLLRDSDSDGLIDGIEDRNRNGRIEPGETDPRQRDSDRDTLCDGYCRVLDVKRICSDLEGSDCLDLEFGRWSGEDKNLNGTVDNGETDPTKWSTPGDNMSDEQRYYQCLLENDGDC